MGEQANALGVQEGWHSQGYAARVHYRGADDRYSVEFYESPACVLYWRVIDGDDAAVPVARTDVPDPLRERVRADLAEAGIDPAVERREV